MECPSRALATAEHSRPLVPPLSKASKKAPLVLVAVLPPDLELVEPDLAPFWLDRFTSSEIRLSALAAVTSSFTLKFVVRAFDTALRVSGHPTRVATFDTPRLAIAWAHLLMMEPAR